MTPTEFATFKYQHTDAPTRSGKRMAVVLGSLLVALVIAWKAFPAGLAALLVPLIAYTSATKVLLLGPRYLLCGKTIVYYGNVKRLTRKDGEGLLRLQSKSGQNFTLARDKFPTSARKAPKVAANKAAKFDKVASKIIEKVRQASKDVELTGV
jgi:hypothetical protein